MEAQLALIGVESCVKLMRPVDAAPIDDHDDLCAGCAECGHPLVDILAGCIGISNAILHSTVGNASSGRRRCRLTPCCAGAAAADQLCRPHAAGRRPWLIVPAGTPGSRERAADHRMPGEEACAAPGGAPAGRWTAAQGTARTGGWRRAACAAWKIGRAACRERGGM